MDTDVLTQDRPAARPARDAARTGQPDSRRPTRPGRRPRPGSPPLKSPVRPTSPVRPPGPGRSGRPPRSGIDEPSDLRIRPAATRSAPSAQAVQQSAEGAGPSSRARRTSFVLLLLGLLGGGMVCLLVVNTTLAANSLEISNLQQQNAARTEQVQELQQLVAAERSAALLEKEATRLGMRPDPALLFVNLRTKSIDGPSGTSTRTRHSGRPGQ